MGNQYFQRKLLSSHCESGGNSGSSLFVPSTLELQGAGEDDDDNNSKAAKSSLAGMTNDELMKLLDVSVLQGHLSNRMGSEMYKFLHDRIQQAAFALLPPGEGRQALRTRIGKTLFQMATGAQSVVDNERRSQRKRGF